MQFCIISYGQKNQHKQEMINETEIQFEIILCIIKTNYLRATKRRTANQPDRRKYAK